MLLAQHAADEATCQAWEQRIDDAQAVLDAG
jgi:hypothetical protein